MAAISRLWVPFSNSKRVQDNDDYFINGTFFPSKPVQTQKFFRSFHSKFYFFDEMHESSRNAVSCTGELSSSKYISISTTNAFISNFIENKLDISEENEILGSTMKLKNLNNEEFIRIMGTISEKVYLNEFDSCLEENVAALLQLGATFEEVISVCIKNRSLSWYHPNSLIFPAFRLLLSYGMTKQEIINTSKRSVVIFTKSLDHLEDVLSFLTKEMGVECVGRIVVSCPSILYLTSQKLREKHHFLQKLGLENVSEALLRFPYLFSYDFETNEFRTKVGGLVDIFGKDVLKNVLRSSPQLLGVPYSTVSATFNWFVEHFGRERALAMVRTCPSVLRNRVSTISMKYYFIRDVMQRDATEIMNDPTVFTYSLKNRLAPRFDALCKLNIQTNYSMSHIFRMSNINFETFLMKEAASAHLRKM